MGANILFSADVHDLNGKIHTIKLSLSSTPIDPTQTYVTKNKIKIFHSVYRVSDVWRYTIISRQGLISKKKIQKSSVLPFSNFNDRPALDAIGTRVIAIILESPHVSEYTANMTPKAPAQGTNDGEAGGAIDTYIEKVLTRMNIPCGTYSLLIVNPIPYMCSLGKFFNKLNHSVRNHVWKKIWEISDIRNDFCNVLATYQPEIIINCCTSKLKPLVDAEIKKMKILARLYSTSHPAVTWNMHKGNQPIEP
ncbi:hypothetical protein [Aeromonas sobria]|uniref:hypothetical protein n=1 Tax=Aeromonas sobria TaxID=646 RepID=UPI001118B642|nr:hypothetical protein [Aeromonas sobria]